MKKQKHLTLKVYSIRAEEEKMHLAVFYDIDTAALFRKALEEEILKRSGKCPSCGQKTRWEKLK